MSENTSSKHSADVEARISSLEARLTRLEAMVAELEKAPAKAAAGSSEDEPEYIVADKFVSQSCTTYYKTSKGRLLVRWSGSIGVTNEDYEKKLFRALVEAGESMRPDAGEEMLDFVARLRAKYCKDMTKPAIIGCMVLLRDGTLDNVSESTKKIKF